MECMTESSEPTVIHHEAERRFEIAVGDQRAGLLEYVDVDGSRVFTHTEVDEAYSGQGLAGILVGRGLDVSKEAGLRLVPVCPYVSKYLGKHPEYADDVQAVTPDLLRAAKADRVRR